MDFDDSFFEESVSRKKKITLQPYKAKTCPRVWFLDALKNEDSTELYECGGVGDVPPPERRRGVDEIHEPVCERLKFSSDYYYLKKMYVPALQCSLDGVHHAPGHRTGFIRDLTETAIRCLLRLGLADMAVPMALGLLASFPSDLSLWQLSADCFYCAGRLHEELLCRQRCIRLNHLNFNLWLSLFAAYRDAALAGTCRNDAQTDSRSMPDTSPRGSCASVYCDQNGDRCACGSARNVHTPTTSVTCQTSTSPCYCLSGVEHVDYDGLVQKWLAEFGCAKEALRTASSRCRQLADDTEDSKACRDIASDTLLRGSSDKLLATQVLCPASCRSASRLDSLPLQSLPSEEKATGAICMAMGCLAHARYHLELSCFSSSSFAKQRSQALLEKVVQATEGSAVSVAYYEACKKAFSLASHKLSNESSTKDVKEDKSVDGPVEENDVYAKVVTPQRGARLGFAHTWFPWVMGETIM